MRNFKTGDLPTPYLQEICNLLGPQFIKKIFGDLSAWDKYLRDEGFSTAPATMTDKLLGKYVLITGNFTAEEPLVCSDLEIINHPTHKIPVFMKRHEYGMARKESLIKGTVHATPSSGIVQLFGNFEDDLHLTSLGGFRLDDRSMVGSIMCRGVSYRELRKTSDAGLPDTFKVLMYRKKSLRSFESWPTLPTKGLLKSGSDFHRWSLAFYWQYMKDLGLEVDQKLLSRKTIERPDDKPAGLHIVNTTMFNNEQDDPFDD